MVDPSAAFNKSIEISRKVQALAPDHGYAYYTMGTAYSFMADYDLSKGKDPSEKLNPNFGESYLIQAKLLLLETESKAPADRRSATEAVKNFERAFAINPTLATQEQESLQQAKSFALN